ncbi:hypothetical protein HJFPF1_02059 [Paramyrothecium foliicola]|nr:hypothetical protein HJFPF1_02059 [Paramyrothecium foliicola]
MSWMDSWSRPSKSQATPAPFYLLPGGESTPYCHSCGRVISSRRTAANNNTNTPAKYCSSRCRTQKPGKLDRELERAFVHFLNEGADKPASSNQGHGKGKKAGKQSKGGHVKGDKRVLVACSTVEEFVFGSHRMSMESTAGSEERALDEAVVLPAYPPEMVESLDDIDLSNDPIAQDQVDGHLLASMSVRSGTRIRPPQSVSEVNGSVGGEKGRAERIEETEEMLEKRREGQKKAKEREMTRCAARRGVVFGFSVGDDAGSGERRLCEAVMAGKVVEPSFAKGDWAIRWRE